MPRADSPRTKPCPASAWASRAAADLHAVETTAVGHAHGLSVNLHRAAGDDVAFRIARLDPRAHRAVDRIAARDESDRENQPEDDAHALDPTKPRKEKSRGRSPRLESSSAPRSLRSLFATLGGFAPKPPLRPSLSRFAGAVPSPG